MGLTLVQQTQLVIPPPSVTLDITPTVGNKVTVVVAMSEGSAQSVADDGGNQYTLTLTPTVPDGSVVEVWSATIKSPSTTVTVVTTEQVTSVTVSEIAPPLVNVAPTQPTQPPAQPQPTQPVAQTKTV
jgi:hypothetical protein